MLIVFYPNSPVHISKNLVFCVAQMWPQTSSLLLLLVLLYLFYGLYQLLFGILMYSRYSFRTAS